MLVKRLRRESADGQTDVTKCIISLASRLIIRNAPLVSLTTVDAFTAVSTSEITAVTVKIFLLKLRVILKITVTPPDL